VTNPARVSRRAVLLLWLFVAILYFIVSFDYIQASMNDRKMAEYLDYVVRLVGRENRPVKEARTLLLIRAEELKIPLAADSIWIRGEGQALRISISYERDIQIPGLRSTVYRKQFEHAAAYH